MRHTLSLGVILPAIELRFDNKMSLVISVLMRQAGLFAVKQLKR